MQMRPSCLTKVLLLSTYLLHTKSHQPYFSIILLKSSLTDTITLLKLNYIKNPSFLYSVSPSPAPPSPSLSHNIPNFYFIDLLITHPDLNNRLKFIASSLLDHFHTAFYTDRSLSLQTLSSNIAKMGFG